MLGGALFHLLPEAITQLGVGPRLSSWFLAGFVGFFLPEKSLWLHEHEPRSPDGARRHPVVIRGRLHPAPGPACRRSLCRSAPLRRRQLPLHRRLRPYPGASARAGALPLTLAIAAGPPRGRWRG